MPMTWPKLKGSCMGESPPNPGGSWVFRESQIWATWKNLERDSSTRRHIVSDRPCTPPDSHRSRHEFFRKFFPDAKGKALAKLGNQALLPAEDRSEDPNLRRSCGIRWWKTGSGCGCRINPGVPRWSCPAHLWRSWAEGKFISDRVEDVVVVHLPRFRFLTFS